MQVSNESTFERNHRQDHSIASLLCALSFATGLSLGNREEHGIRAAYIGLRIAEYVGLSADERAAVYYGALLKDVGCTACAANFAAFFPTTDNGLGLDMLTVDTARLGDMIAWMNRHVPRDRLFPERLARMTSFLAQCGTVMQESMRGHCETAELFAGRLGFSTTVQEALRYQLERWDGKGMAYHRTGNETPVAARIIHLAGPSDLAYGFGGLEGLKSLVQGGQGTRFDPDIASVLKHLTADREFLQLLSMEETRQLVLDMRPDTDAEEKPRLLDDICEALADFVDLKVLDVQRHSTRVAHIAQGIATSLGLNAAECTRVRRAGLTHDLGKVTVPYGVLAKASNGEKLTTREVELDRFHPYYSERLLLQIPALANLAPDVGAHHEQWDGHGYFRGVKGTEIPLDGRVLAAAEAYSRGCDCSGEELDRVLESLRERVNVAFDPHVFAGLEAWATGQSGPVTHRRKPDRTIDLTAREREVLRLVAKGLSNREIARQLVISNKTVEHHLEHIYSKLGVTSRTAALACAITEDALTESP